MFLKVLCRKNKVRAVGLLCLVLACAVSCIRPNGGMPVDAVARVGESYLTKRDLEKMMPVGMLPNDSADMAGKKTEAWVGQQVLLRKAKQNLDEEAEAEIEAQIARYRESLLVFLYENKITRQLLDTVVSDKEIEDYYKANQSQFVLKSNIVRVRFVKVVKTFGGVNDIRRELFAVPFEEKNLVAVADLCRESAENYFLDADRWIFFNDLLREVPIHAYNQEVFLKNNRKIEVNAGDYIYLVAIEDFKVRDMISPISLEKERIRTIILNQRKKTVQEEMERDLMEEARGTGMIEYY